MALFVPIGFMAGTAWQEWISWKANRKQLMIEDYIRLHPEDFPLAGNAWPARILIEI